MLIWALNMIFSLIARDTPGNEKSGTIKSVMFFGLPLMKIVVLVVVISFILFFLLSEMLPIRELRQIVFKLLFGSGSGQQNRIPFSTGIKPDSNKVTDVNFDAGSKFVCFSSSDITDVIRESSSIDVFPANNLNNRVFKDKYLLQTFRSMIKEPETEKPVEKLERVSDSKYYTDIQISSAKDLPNLEAIPVQPKVKVERIEEKPEPVKPEAEAKPGPALGKPGPFGKMPIKPLAQKEAPAIPNPKGPEEAKPEPVPKAGLTLNTKPMGTAPKLFSINTNKPPGANPPTQFQFGKPKS